jgi:hypothetical protein
LTAIQRFSGWFGSASGYRGFLPRVWWLVAAVVVIVCSLPLAVPPSHRRKARKHGYDFDEFVTKVTSSVGE